MAKSKEGLNAPLASALIRKVFPVYLAFAVGLTLIQVGIEYRETRAAVAAELDATAHSFEPVVADALWNYQHYLLPKFAEVILSAGVVTGVDIGDARRLYVTHDADEQNIGEWSKQVELLHTDDDGAPKRIGYITLYSSHAVVIERVKLGVLLIVAAAALKTLGLWLIIVFFVRRLLARPLRSFTEQIAAFDLAQATSAPRVDLGAGQAAELVYLCDSFNDLAQRAVTTNRLTTEKEAAEAANLAKSRFLAAASHDLRQPMHAINLYLGTLAGYDLQRPVRALLAKARQCTRAMDEMFRALLDISRLDASAVQPEIRTFPIAAVLDHIWIEFAPEARAKGVALRVVTSSAFVHSDVAMVERILRNLVANAVRYTDSGKILVGCRRRGESLRLAVYDTGPGIPAEMQQAIFEEFYQLGNSERDRGKGMGLGLAIVQRLAKLLALPIMVSSRLGRGSVFAVDLPCRETGEPFSTDVLHQIVECNGLAGLSVLVIDDDEMILDATRALLERWGCKVITARSGAEVLSDSIGTPPDALLCDRRLCGGEDGISVIKALRAEWNRDIPALLITGDTAPECIRDVASSGLPVLHKPIHEEKLRRALLQLCGKDTAVSERALE